MSDPNAPNRHRSAYQRWEMASFDPPPPPPPPPTPDETAAFEAELQRLRDAAHQEGLKAGHVAGQALGFQAGHEQGLRKGFEQGQAVAHAQAAQLAALASRFSDALETVHAGVAQTLVELALDIAQQVVRQHVQHDPTALVAVAREVLAAEPQLAGSPQLVVSPADLPIVEAYLMEDLQARGWTVRTDPAIERGGCRAQAATGEIDASVRTRWERVTAALDKARPW
ncbi:flagellar assembly protein FliH [Paraburkholderia lycopersici]|uniref:Flagellar assembly protein FliH n=1 Tax=Paraburkholderia lycopersici TaxID=416944 RepID=A0A1G6T254_9BURK|nr:flagellar assembly protein FliH [Paraburkholderia lycopersici]SDD22465.1 flagellar assembly protein FliH [Paraburkholderia lycopersici]